MGLLVDGLSAWWRGSPFGLFVTQVDWLLVGGWLIGWLVNGSIVMIVG